MSEYISDLKIQLTELTCDWTWLQRPPATLWLMDGRSTLSLRAPYTHVSLSKTKNIILIFNSRLDFFSIFTRARRRRRTLDPSHAWLSSDIVCSRVEVFRNYLLIWISRGAARADLQINLFHVSRCSLVCRSDCSLKFNTISFDS